MSRKHREIATLWCWFIGVILVYGPFRNHEIPIYASDFGIMAIGGFAGYVCLTEAANWIRKKWAS